VKKSISVIAVCLFCLFIAGSTAYGQGVWAEKPFEQWTKKEALKILSDSPWVGSDQLLDANAILPSQTLRSKSEEDSISEGFKEIVRLRSALVIRQAFLRQKQISIKYDKMKPEERAKFDADAREFVECAPCAKYYIVSVENWFIDALFRNNKKMSSPEALQARAFLANDKGVWRECVHVRRENQETLYFFKRTDDEGKALITSDNKAFGFTRNGKIVEGKLVVGSYYDFDVSSITVNNEIMF
jgi:hypothetical protein